MHRPFGSCSTTTGGPASFAGPPTTDDKQTHRLTFCSGRVQTASPMCRLFDPPTDKRSAGRRESRALPIPSSYVYSPSLVPRPQDWPDHVQVLLSAEWLLTP